MSWSGASEFQRRVTAVRGRIDGALRRAGRPPRSVLLVAVSKTFPPDAVVEAALAGQAVFGENRVQEAAEKIPRVADLLSGSGASGVAPPTWHLVGHLQSNKAAAAVRLFDLIHSVDDAELARKLDRAIGARSVGEDLSGGQRKSRQAVLIQVNVSGEDAKSGVAPDGLHRLVDSVVACEQLELRGLMTIPSHAADPEESRTHFAALRLLGEKVREWLGSGQYPCELSMGMTEDFEVAIEEGATIVRIGRAIFGDRPLVRKTVAH